MIRQMIAYAVDKAENDIHGYSQYNRWPWQGNDFDCSSLMYSSANAAGYNVPMQGYTGTMINDFSDAGFSIIPFNIVGLDGLKVGDILLNTTHHTEMYIGNGKFVGAHCAENGGIHGQSGDQTGNEISIIRQYIPTYGWDYVLRPYDKYKDWSDEEMACIFTPKGKNYRVFYDGGKCHICATPEEAEAATYIYRMTRGENIPEFDIDAKLAKAFTNLCNR